MIEKTFVQCAGIGPQTELKLKLMGFQCWDDCLKNPKELPFKGERKDKFIRELVDSKEALEFQDIHYFVERLPQREHWRILADFHEKATFFDIETNGLSSYESHATVIAAYGKGELKTYVYGENMDDFLELAENSDLLVTFNGNSFDIPFLLSHYNIPDIGSAYIDLRWISFHAGYKGGLKHIEQEMKIFRPFSLIGVDGFEAVLLWERWKKGGDEEAKQKLIAYCQADTIATCLVADQLLVKKGLVQQPKDPGKLFSLIELPTQQSPRPSNFFRYRR